MDAAEPQARWRKSSFSANDDCVEWSAGPDVVRVRSTKRRDRELVVTPAAWTELLEAIKAGEADVGR